MGKYVIEINIGSQITGIPENMVSEIYIASYDDNDIKMITV